jgi:hypothetical protein
MIKTKELKTMIKKAIWIIAGVLLVHAGVMGQCNNRLVEKAARQAGSDAVYIRDFKVKLSQGTMDEPAPTGKFPVYLNKGVVYRFSVANAEEFTGKAIVEITRRDQVYAGNYDFTQKVYSESFDFTCDRSSTYQILINYGVGKEGCSVVVMSMVYQDSMAYIEPGVPEKSDSAGTLFLFSENKLQIVTSAGKDAKLDVKISQGTIGQKGQYFIARPQNLGDASVMVEVMKEGNIVESDTVMYTVEYPPLPIIQLPGEVGGTLSLRTFTGIGNVSFLGAFDEESPYMLKQFSIASGKDALKEEISDGAKLSPQQIMLIRKTLPGNRIIIQKARFVDPEGQIHTAPDYEILITE